MKTVFHLLFASVIAMHSAAQAGVSAWNGTSSITFNGTSTLHAWAGKVSAEPFVASVTMNDAGQPTALKAKVEVKAAGMDTAEPDRDVKMRKSMKVTDHPLISGVMDTAFDKIMGADGKPAKLPFALTLVGKTHQISASISNWKLSGNIATFDLDFPVSLKASGISVPTVLLFIKVGDGIKVHASVTLTQN